MKYYSTLKSVYSIKKYFLLSRKTAYRFLITLGVVLFLSACSVEKNTGTTRFYHGLTARFNIWFNGYEAYKSGLERIEKNYRDDYSEVLRVFENSDPSAVSLCSSDMERAIQKASKLISLKSITAKPEIETRRDLSEKEKALLGQKEFNEWVDDSYFLIGRARFHKHEFDDAFAVFTYCIAEANDPEIKEESRIWLARINCEKGNFSEAARILGEAEPGSTSPRSLKALYNTTMADMFIRQKRYGEAIGPLTSALDFISGKRAKYRLTYLLAQLHELTGDSEKSIALYRSVLKMNPPYDVAFNARINIAGVFDISSGDPDDIKNELLKMLRDSKNNEYQDQIYYALGNLMKKEGNVSEALGYYARSASLSSTNQNQKGKSYLALAGHYYSIPDYIRSANYYDSALYFLDKSYPGYNELNAKTRDLNTLVEHLTTIQMEDSLQKVAAMPEAQRNALISGIIAKVTKEEAEGRSSEYSDRANMGQFYENQRRFQDNIDQEGKWYFYNQTALTFGRSEFRRRWGERRLEDNWRRSNRNRVNNQQFASGQEEEGKGEADSSQNVLDNRKPEFYLRNLPLNDTMLAASNDRIANAYFNSAKVFTGSIGDRTKAAEAYEALMTRYPGHPLAPEALYDLYNLFRDSDSRRSESARQRLLENYPESEFAKIISDPDYFSRKMAAIKLSEKLYQEAYDLYINENFDSAIIICEDALKRNPGDPLAPKFMLLKAYSVARTSDERRLREELNGLRKAFPDSDEGLRAAELIAHLDKEMPELRIEEDIVVARELYTVDTAAQHTFVIIIESPSFNVNQAAFDVISYNIDNYTNRNFRTEGVLTDNRYIRITVSGFANNTEAWNYYFSFDAGKIIRNASGAPVMTFLINNENLLRLDEDKNPGRYHLFFEENYLSAKKNR